MILRNWVKRFCYIYICIYMFIYRDINLYIYIYIILKLKYEIFFQWNTKFFLQTVLGLLHFGSSQNCMSSANLVAKYTKNFEMKEFWALENHVLVNMLLVLQSFYRGRFGIHWYIAHFYPIFSMSVLFRRSFKTVIFWRLL